MKERKAEKESAPTTKPVKVVEAQKEIPQSLTWNQIQREGDDMNNSEVLMINHEAQEKEPV